MGTVTIKFIISLNLSISRRFSRCHTWIPYHQTSPRVELPVAKNLGWWNSELSGRTRDEWGPSHVPERSPPVGWRVLPPRGVSKCLSRAAVANALLRKPWFTIIIHHQIPARSSQNDWGKTRDKNHKLDGWWWLPMAFMMVQDGE